MDTVNKTSVGMSIYNRRNNKVIEIGEEDRISKIRNDADFHKFMNYYIKTCPLNYFDKIKALRESGHVTIRYKTGDVFRMEIDRFHYGYGIITGQVKEILKWKELPENHSLRKLMMVPIMVRFYDVCTTDENLSVEDLAGLPLGRVEICGDNDIIWGTATTIMPYEQISPKLKEYLREYRSPHGGVAMDISNIDLKGEEAYKFKYNLLNDINKGIREEVFRCLQLRPDASFDEFANKFGGLTKEEMLKKKL